MRILQVLQKPQRRGAEISTLQLSRKLQQLGHVVNSVFLYPNYGANSLQIESGDSVLDGIESHPLEKIPGVHPGLLKRFTDCIQDFKPDIVQVNGARTVKYGAFSSYCLRWKKWVLVYRSIGNPLDWIRDPARRFLYRRIVWPKIDGLIGVCSASLDQFERAFHFSVPVKRIFPGVDPKVFVPRRSREAVRQSLQVPLEAAVIIFVGSLSPEKRPDRMLRIAGEIIRLGRLDLYLWILGAGPLRDKLQEQAASIASSTRIRLLGAQEDVASYMNASDLLVLTSDTEGIPGVILEAGLVGLPVVASRVGGVSECVINMETGCSIEPSDETEFVSSVTQLLGDSQLRERMGRQAKVWIEGNFAISNIAPEYVRFYEQVLSFRGLTV